MQFSAICKNVATGNCKFGSLCKFSHAGYENNLLRKTKLCAYFAQGNCTKTDAECNFRHDRAAGGGGGGCVDKIINLPQQRKPCDFFARTGSCTRGDACGYIHARIAGSGGGGGGGGGGKKPCDWFTRTGSCTRGDACGYLHIAATSVQQYAGGGGAGGKGVNTMQRSCLTCKRVFDTLEEREIHLDESGHRNTKQSVEVIRTGERADFHIMVVGDASGSMSGSRIKNATEGMATVYQNMHPTKDMMQVITFNSKGGCKTVLPMTSKTHAPFTSRIAPHIDRHGNIICGGGTALYDAIKTALIELANFENIHNSTRPPAQHSKQIMAIFSDGEDNQSTLPRDICISYLLHPEILMVQSGFMENTLEFMQVFLLSVGNESDTHVLDFAQIASLAPERIIHKNAKNAEEIKSFMSEITVLTLKTTLKNLKTNVETVIIKKA